VAFGPLVPNKLIDIRNFRTSGGLILCWQIHGQVATEARSKRPWWGILITGSSWLGDVQESDMLKSQDHTGLETKILMILAPVSILFCRPGLGIAQSWGQNLLSILTCMPNIGLSTVCVWSTGRPLMPRSIIHSSGEPSTTNWASNPVKGLSAVTVELTTAKCGLQPCHTQPHCSHKNLTVSVEPILLCDTAKNKTVELNSFLFFRINIDF